MADDAPAAQQQQQQPLPEGLRQRIAAGLLLLLFLLSLNLIKD